MDLKDFHWAVKYTHGRLLQTIYTEWTKVRARDQQSFLTSFYQLKNSLDKPALTFVSDIYQFYAFEHIFKNRVSQPYILKCNFYVLYELIGKKIIQNIKLTLS